MRSTRPLVPLLAAAFALLAAPAFATTATLHLDSGLAVWSETTVVHVTGVGCTGVAPVQEPVNASRDVDVRLTGCDALASQPFAFDVPLPTLVPATYRVRLIDAGSAQVIDDATLEVHSRANVRIDVPPVAGAGAVHVTLHGPSASGCGSFDGPETIDGRTEFTFDNQCPILTPPFPVMTTADATLTLTPGRHEIVAYDLTWTATRADAPMVRATVDVVGPDGCVPDDRTLCLAGRFAARVTWHDFQGTTGMGHPRPLPGRDASGLFWFFTPDNVEQTLKVIDGCALNGHWWVFLSSSTTVATELLVTDVPTGRTRLYEQASGEAAPLLTDTAAFPCE